MDKSLSDGSRLTEDMAAIGLGAGSKLIYNEMVPASTGPKAQTALELAPDDLMHHFVQLRTVDDLPMAKSDTDTYDCAI